MNEEDVDKKYSTYMRTISFFSGIGFIVLGAADAMLDPFPGPETFFGGTGISLIVIGITGKKPKQQTED